MKKYILFLLLSFQTIAAQVEFEAKASRQSIRQNETIRVDFIVNADGDNFDPPSFEGFNVVGGPSSRISSMNYNGRRTLTKAVSYFLMPKQRGTLTIHQATIEVNGQVYKSNPIKITVGEALQENKDPNVVQTTADQAIHLVAEVSKSNPYINEPLTIVYKLYCGPNIRVTNWQELDKPKYNDFWSQDIEVPLKVAEGEFNGKPYLYVVLKKVVLYPQKSGKLTVEPLSLDVNVQIPTHRNAFGQYRFVDDNIKVSAGAKTITVKSLPEAGRPEDFSGAVGKFDFSAKATKTNIKHGESFDLAVTVNGTGNLKLFDLPKPVVPAALEMYDPVRKDNVKTPTSGMHGRITETYTIVPGSKGNYTIEPLSFSYFDPSTGKYRTITSDQILVRVIEGEGIITPAETGGVQKQAIAATEQFQFIKLKTDLQPMSRPDFFGSTLFYSLLVLPFLAIPALILIRRRKEAVDKDVSGNRTRTSNLLAKKYLSEAKKRVDTKELFYIALEKALHNFLRAKLAIETSEMNKEKIREILLSRNADPTTVDDFLKLVENCEFARYAPSSSGAIEQDYERAVSLISTLEKQL